MFISAPSLLRRIAELSRSVAPSALGVAFALALSGDAQAADQWKDKGKECDQTVFADPGAAAVSDLSKCSKAWVAYRTDYKAVKGDYKDRVVMAMKLLYAKGDESDAERSQEILSRLGVTDLPSRSGAKASGGGGGTGKAAAKPERKPFDPPEPDKKAIAAAEKHFKAGIAAYGKKDLAKAAAAYEKMIEAAPGYAKGHYNAACIYSLQKDEKKMANALMNLRDMTGSKSKVVAEKANEMLERVKTDEDFKETRYESPEYKRIMGFAKVKVINHLGEKGEENIDNLMGSLKKLGYESAMKESDRKVAKFPIIYFTDHSKNQAYIIKQLIEHPKLEAKYLDKDKLCGDDGCYDVVVQWNDDVKGDPKRHVADPKEAEKKIEDLEAKQDEMLRKPDEVLDEVDDALSKPDEVTDKVEELTNKPGKAIEKGEKTFEKIKGKF